MQFCAFCGHRAKETDRFCIDCGTPLGGSPPAGEAEWQGQSGVLRNVPPDDPFGYLYAPRDRTARSPGSGPPAAGYPLGSAAAGSGFPAPAAGDRGVPAPASGGDPARSAVYDGAPTARARSRRRGTWLRPVALAGAVVLAAAGGGFAVLHELGHQPRADTGTDAAAEGDQPASVASQSHLGHGDQKQSRARHGQLRQPQSRKLTAPAASHSRHRRAAGTALVGVSGAVAGERHAQPVAEFVTRYFSAINQHDYPAYRSLLTPGLRASFTPQAFASGYGTTSDSGATLRAVRSAAAGELVAAITFTSHQSPADSPVHASCTAWRIVMYLVPQRAGYQITRPPASYHAAYRRCG
jgi:hypothetical protein